MADTKISALPSATTPLAGTEVLPLVQAGGNVKVAVSDLTAGRAVSALSFAGPLNGTVGATTPTTGAFTTLSASNTATFNKGSSAVDLTPVSTAASARTNLSWTAKNASSANRTTYFGSNIFLADGSTELSGEFAVNLMIDGVTKAALTSTGLAVTGTLSATGVTYSYAGTQVGGSGGVTWATGTQYIDTIGILGSSGSSLNQTAGIQFGDNFGGGSRQWAIYNGRNATTTAVGTLNFMVSSGTNIDAMSGTGTTVASLSSTGLAVTGTLSATGDITSTGAIKANLNGANAYAILQADSSGAAGGKIWTLASNATGSPIGTAGGLSVRSSTDSITVANFTSTGLAVTGALSSTLGATIQGLTVGLGAGAVASNTAVGVSALAANTTGSYNTALGIQAGQLNTTGIQSTFIGGLAGYNNTTGSITAVGYAALAFNTTGTSNVAVGHNNGAGQGGALQANTTGSANSALGVGSLSTNTTGANNTAVGSSALAANTTASNNTAVGYQAGYSNTTGTLNTYLGQTAGYSNSTGSYCTYIGRAAGYLSTGTANTFVGHVAGYTSTGGGNTFVGSNSNTGYGAGFAMTTGSDNTILGGYDGNQGGLDIRTASNYIVLSDGDGNPLISTNSTRSVALNGAVPQTGTGITFPATQSASTDANTLDDYEEGTWTPTVGGTATYNVQSGVYTKIGRLVEVSFAMGITLLGTGSTTTISGLPFAQIAAAWRSTGAVGYYNSLAVNVLSVVSVVDVATTSIFFSGSTTASANITDSLAIFGNGANMYSSITYTA
jgi:hypothetical protein